VRGGGLIALVLVQAMLVQLHVACRHQPLSLMWVLAHVQADDRLLSHMTMVCLAPLQGGGCWPEVAAHLVALALPPQPQQPAAAKQPAEPQQQDVRAGGWLVSRWSVLARAPVAAGRCMISCMWRAHLTAWGLLVRWQRHLPTARLPLPPPPTCAWPLPLLLLVQGRKSVQQQSGSLAKRSASASQLARASLQSNEDSMDWLAHYEVCRHPHLRDAAAGGWWLPAVPAS